MARRQTTVKKIIYRSNSESDTTLFALKTDDKVEVCSLFVKFKW